MKRRELLRHSCAVASLVGLGPCAARGEEGAVPGLSGPLADMAHARLVWGVEGQRYVAAEFRVSGRADVLESVSMADAVDAAARDHVADQARRDFVVKTIEAARPYQTRLVVYRPADPARFSGTVIVETTHPLGGGRNLVWADLNAYWMARGDAYVAVQHPATLPGLAAVDAGRYGTLRAAHPTQLWGMLADAGRLIKAPGDPLRVGTSRVRRLFMTGYSFTGVATATFANYHHGGARLTGGAPLFDGYVPIANVMYVRALDVPVMRINTQSDFNSFGGLRNRKPDSDDPRGRYRHYEVTGAAHISAPWPLENGATPPAGPPLPVPPGQPHIDATACRARFPKGSLPNDFPLRLVMARTFDNLTAWVDAGERPPHAPWLDVDALGASRLDAAGNALGGLRLPPVTVPVATYGVGHGTDCFLFGYRLPFDANRLRQLYGSREHYVERVSQAATRLVTERFLRPEAVQELVRHAEGTNLF